MAARNSQDLACCWARDRECALEVAFRFRRIRLRRLELDFSSDAIDLGLEPFFLGCCYRTHAFTNAASGLIKLAEFTMSCRQV